MYCHLFMVHSVLIERMSASPDQCCYFTWQNEKVAIFLHQLHQMCRPTLPRQSVMMLQLQWIGSLCLWRIWTGAWLTDHCGLIGRNNTRDVARFSTAPDQDCSKRSACLPCREQYESYRTGARPGSRTLCHWTSSHHPLWLFFVNGLKHFYFVNRFLTFYCSFTVYASVVSVIVSIWATLKNLDWLIDLKVVVDSTALWLCSMLLSATSTTHNHPVNVYTEVTRTLVQAFITCRPDRTTVTR